VHHPVIVSGRSKHIILAQRRASAQITAVVGDCVARRHAAGLSQSKVASVIGCSRQLVGLMEGGHIQAGIGRLAAYAAAVGLDLSLKAFDGGSPLRDAGQLPVLARFQASISPGDWSVESEVPVLGDPRDRRAFDLVLRRMPAVVAVEGISHLGDSQDQVRRIVLKQHVAGIPIAVIVLADTRHNRAAAQIAAPTLEPAFPLPPRAVMRALRAGELPEANGIVFI
jgi:transcriptional regulator with XRE-family HTH domain